MSNEELALSCDAQIGDVNIQGSNYFKIMFTEESFKKFCKERDDEVIEKIAEYVCKHIGSYVIAKDIRELKGKL